MNRSDARAIKKDGSWVGQYRLLWKTRYETVMNIDQNGDPKGERYFDDRRDAELAAWREKQDIEQPVLVRAGEKMSAQHIKAAHAHFKPMTVSVRRDEGDGAWLRELIAKTKTDQVKE